MIYLVFPEADYTYEHLLLSKFLLSNSTMLLPSGAPQSRQITCMIQVPRQKKLEHYYKDVRWNDQNFSKERIRSLKGNGFVTDAALNESGFQNMFGKKFSEVENEHPHQLKYNMQYEINFHDSDPILIDLLIHCCDTEPFLKLASEFASKHETEPLLFHNGSGQGWEYRFSDFATALYENGYRHYLTSAAFQKKLLHEASYNSVNHHASFAGYRLYTLSR
jgi:hypothetical protein